MRAAKIALVIRPAVAYWDVGRRAAGDAGDEPTSPFACLLVKPSPPESPAAEPELGGVAIRGGMREVERRQEPGRPESAAPKRDLTDG